MKRRSLNVPPEGAGSALEDFLAGALGMKVEEARQLVARGAVYLQGKRCKLPGTKLQGGQSLMVVLEEGGRSALAPPPPAPPLPPVLFEDAHVIAVDKPAGINAQPSPGSEGDSLLDVVSGKLGRPAGLVHRLDRETSGVTVFGKTPGATTALAAQFREGTAKKRYLAVAGPNLPAAGVIDLPLSKDPSRPGRFRALKGAQGVPALTEFTTLHAAEDFCLVALFPQTGRTHQLRAHLTALGAPITGDARYGGRKKAGGVEVARCLLHAQALRLLHPASGKELLLEAPVPEDLLRFFRLAALEPPHGPW
ncbi:MAG TPA: RluA family pseudouridine synthase [Myxococcaceae bacterium]|nr:RluA family pseudouridine synthase [Myxococcaceae bacterium]